MALIQAFEKPDLFGLVLSDTLSAQTGSFL